jgi:DNA-binding MarR family transcriptional regulator
MDSSFACPEYLSYRVKRLYLLISQRIDEVLKCHGLARSQWQILFRVSRAGTLTQKDLQHAMQVESATLTCIVDVLVAKGWLERLERLESAEDKRVRVVRLTEEGRALMESVPDPYETVEGRMLQGVTEPDRTHVEALLDQMIRNLEERS